jgi:hypothetical protein
MGTVDWTTGWERWIGQSNGTKVRTVSDPGIKFRPLSRGVKKNGEKFRKETSTVQPERSGGRLLVLGIFRHFLASGIKPAAFLFGSVSLSAVRKRNEHVQSRRPQKRSPTPQGEKPNSFSSSSSILSKRLSLPPSSNYLT